jgi:hypothetical protein
MALQAAIVLTSHMDQLEVFCNCKSLKSLIVQLASGLHILCAIQLVKGHVEPFNQ